MSDSNLDHHLFYHFAELPPRVNLHIEKNSRGINWEVTILNATSTEEGIKLLEEARQKMAELYGDATQF